MESTGSIWVGVLVRLRAFEASDAAYSGWNDDSEQQRTLDFIPLQRSQQADREWIDRETRRERHDDDDFRFVIENMDHQVVGDLTVHHADRRTGTFSYGISIARPHRRRGYAREGIQLILRYYFDELRYQKVTVYVSEFNDASINLHEGLGFQTEGRLRRVVYTRGRNDDQLMFGLLSEEYRTQFPTACHAC